MVPVRRKAVEELGDLSPYSAYVMYDVIEHLLHPHAFCSALHDLTSERATLFVSTTCLDSWSAIPPAGWESYYLRVAPTFTFSRSTLDSLLASAGEHVRSWSAAPKGDQWVLAVKANRSAPRRRLSHAGEVKAMIDAYRRRCQEAGS